MKDFRSATGGIVDSPAHCEISDSHETCIYRDDFDTLLAPSCIDRLSTMQAANLR
jgi:hypothetical protein